MSQLEKIYGVHAVQALLQHHPKRVKQVWLSEGRSEPRLQKLLELAAENRVAVGQAERRELDAWVEGVHQGVVAEVSPSQVWGELMLEELLEAGHPAESEAAFRHTLLEFAELMLFLLVGVLDAGAKKAPVASTKSGRDALLAAADAASESVLGNAGDRTTAASPGLLMPPKDVMPERIQRMSQDAIVSMFKGVEAIPLAGAALRDRVQEPGTSTRGAGSDALAPLSGLQQSAGGAMGVDGVFAGSATEAMGEQFSEDVKYWVGQDMQKAELTLDGFGHSAVEVSISLQGNEAHVAFRTDEAQTRDALSSASTQLQDALNRQGMSLAGVSVGTSNAGDSRDKAGQGQSSPWRRARVEGAEDVAVSSGIKPLNSGRNIDLFV